MSQLDDESTSSKVPTDEFGDSSRLLGKSLGLELCIGRFRCKGKRSSYLKEYRCTETIVNLHFHKNMDKPCAGSRFSTLYVYKFSQGTYFCLTADIN